MQHLQLIKCSFSEKQYEAVVWRALQEKGLYRGKADNKMSLPQCSRSKDIIEPKLKPQWWVNCQDMAAQACTTVRDGNLQILPKEFEAVWFRCVPLPHCIALGRQRRIVPHGTLCTWWKLTL